MSNQSTSPQITFWEFFQSLGKTFMLPVALLSFCGILLGIGSSLSSEGVIAQLPWLGNPTVKLFFQWMAWIGDFAFGYLPVMFAIAIPLGLARDNKGVAAFSGFIGFAVFNLSINFYLKQAGILESFDELELKKQNIKAILGVQTIDTGILGAIIVGIVVYFLHEKFHRTELPDAFSFFGGVRFVPIITLLTMNVLGLAIPFIWPFFAAAINGLGSLIQGAGIFAPFLFGAGERFLLPFGLHHILVTLIRFTEAGGTLEVCNNTISGALLIFKEELACSEVTEFSVSATRFLSQGKMPAFLGGLPGAALAIYHCAKPANRMKIKGLLISGVIACMVGGTTEPIEFLFLFVAPFLFVIHAILTGLGFMIMGLLDVTIGNTDGNIIDFIVLGVLQGTKTNWHWVPVIAGLWFVIYYIIFRFAITKFDIPTPGREKDSNEALANEFSGTPANFDSTGYDIEGILVALGGKKNIVSLDNCITRLRLSVQDMSLVQENKLKSLKALGVVKLNDHNLQVVIGTKVQTVKDGLEKLMKVN
ncbi:maltose/glucose-specific PTS transporter subunit IIBC [Thorsellia kenyensis]|uniref:Maltose/glucose-specific PTS transporter subunit IIBC n=1 Tax=Thorsellia kenyensis TaxID=1549888 RepID=A0ABV6C7A6_9GAMM